ncbi:MAG: purine-nucleoside phosphorylase [Burkholderiales bacterium]|nr:purine-nucleoside phosphorylase [Burkholderiales bacterium]
MSEALSPSAARLRASGFAPRIAVLLGSGWGGLVDRLAGSIAIDYAELPAFAAPGVGGHAARVHLGRLGGREVALLAGRRHAYEDGRADGMKAALRCLAAAGVEVLVQTNAAGSLDPALRPGELMLIEDHLNVAQRSPLVGESGDARFVDLCAAYDPLLREQALAAAAARGIALAGGVYAWVLGPQFETPAEIRWLRGIGARAVGMSTVPETIIARHAGLRVLAFSLITNMAAGMEAQALSHAHTLAAAERAGARAADLLEAVVARLEWT